MVQLRKLGNVYKRPIAVFYLPRPPKHFQALRDFRRLQGTAAEPDSPALRLEIRRAHYRRDVALELYQALGEEPPHLQLTAQLDEDTETIGVRIRTDLGIRTQVQVDWKTPYDALNGWRDALEANGVLVFQAGGIEIEEARGFSIHETPLPVVAVNTRDAPRGRTFSMLHELAHVLLRRGGLCDLREDGRPPELQHTEVFCNQVAAAALLPAAALLSEETVRQHGETPTWLDSEIKTLANRYQVSREVVLRRLLTLGRTTREFYRQKRGQFQEEYRQQRDRQSGGPGVASVALSHVGPLFARLVLDSYAQEKITSSDVAEYLDIRLKHLPALRQRLNNGSWSEAA